MKTPFFAALILSAPLLVQGCVPGPEVEERHVSQACSTDTTTGIVHYGTRGHEVLYVVFSLGKPGIQGIVVVTTEPIKNYFGKITGQRYTALMVVSGKVSRVLKDKGSLFEYSGGDLRQDNFPLTANQLEAYLSSSPKEYSLKSLRKFASAHP